MLTKTTTQLLDGLMDTADAQVWREFDSRYRPIVIAFALRLGLREVDACDAAQDTLARFVKEYRAGKYDRGRGRLRSWLIGIAKHAIQDMQRKDRGAKNWRGMSALEHWPDDRSLTQYWDEESRTTILRQGVQLLRTKTNMEPRTIHVFELLAFEHHKPSQVAKIMGMNRNEVYLAKHRCLDKLRGIVTQLTEAYEIVA